MALIRGTKAIGRGIGSGATDPGARGATGAAAATTTATTTAASNQQRYQGRGDVVRSAAQNHEAATATGSVGARHTHGNLQDIARVESKSAADLST